MAIHYCVNILNTSELFAKNSQKGKQYSLCNSIQIHGNACDFSNHTHSIVPPVPPAGSWPYPIFYSTELGKWMCQFWLATQLT